MDDDTFFRPLDNIDDICLLPHGAMDLRKMVLDLEKEASRIGLKIQNKPKVFCVMGHCTLKQFEEELLVRFGFVFRVETKIVMIEVRVVLNRDLASIKKPLGMEECGAIKS